MIISKRETYHMYVQEELSIKAMTISQIYSLYINDKLIVNRKYQRKLCWSIEEKRNFLDTIIKGLPVPMFLFAITESGQYEIIDGMQRLDSICSFIAQKYNIKDGNFNLESMPDTIEQIRNNRIQQKGPVLSSTICKGIANYPLPISVFPASNDDDVEEVFKRINSTGKHLSLQELRQVGIGTQFATMVRQLASEIRGDISEDKLLLKDMSNISLSNYRLPYSIYMKDIFWVKNGIINEPEMRQSRDEEAIAYILSNMILSENERKLFSNQMLNKFYGYSPNPLDDSIPLEMTQINNAIDRIGFETVKKQFRIVMSCFEEMINAAGKSFRQITNAPTNISDLIISFQIVFMAIHKLVIKQGKTDVNYSLFAKKLDGHCGNIINTPLRKISYIENAINAISGLIQDAFSQGVSEDPALDDWTMEFTNILNKSRTEQNLYDFKLGFVPLYGNEIDYGVVDQVIKTLTAINNIGPNRTGYVIMGVGDKESDAIKCKEKYSSDYIMINEIPLCGIEHDAIAISQSIDRYTHTVKEYIRNCTDVSEAYRLHLLTQMKTPMFYGKHTIVFKTCYSEPVPFGNMYYIREFSDVHKLDPNQIPSMFQNYYKKY